MSRYRDPLGHRMIEKLIRDQAILALRMQNEALPKDKEGLELRRIEVERTKAETWNGQLPVNVYAGAAIPFFNPQKGA